MNLSKEFLPYTGPPDLKDAWKKYILAFFLFSVPTFFLFGDDLGMRLIFEALIFIVFIIYIFNDRMTVNVTISIPDKTLAYYTVNCFGIKRATKIYLPTAIINYEYRQVRKFIKGMCLKIYGKDGNNITLKEDMNGYHQEQLDHIIALISELKP